MYEEQKDDDVFLYMTYSRENTFGTYMACSGEDTFGIM
jgi:hypothetical protein